MAGDDDPTKTNNNTNANSAVSVHEPVAESPRSYHHAGGEAVGREEEEDGSGAGTEHGEDEENDGGADSGSGSGSGTAGATGIGRVAAGGSGGEKGGAGGAGGGTSLDTGGVHLLPVEAGDIGLNDAALLRASSSSCCFLARA